MLARAFRTSSRRYSSAQVTTLSNGLRVASQKTADEVATVGLWIEAGSRDESAQNVGTSRLVQALGNTVDEQILNLGGCIEATVGRDQTAYSVKVGASNLSKAVEAITKKSKGNLEQFDAVKEQVLVRQDDHRPLSDILYDRLHMTSFRDCPLGNSLLGPHDNFAALTHGTTEAYLKENYTADRMVLAAAGPVDHAELVKLAEANLGKIAPAPPRPVMEKPYFCGAELIYRNEDIGPTAYISIGWESVPAKNPDAIVFMVMQHILGSYDKFDYYKILPGELSGNRTINNIANKMNVGCADQYHFFNHAYRDTGLFGFFSACDEIAVEHCVSELQFGVTMLAGPVTEEEVERGKRELRMAMCSFLDGTKAMASNLANQLLRYDRYIPPEEFEERLSYIDREEVVRVAWKYLHDTEVSCTALGPLHGLPPLYELRWRNMLRRY